ncbi:MAG: phosphoribosylformylglycinamidine synthase subunit PurQ [Candidatus Bathyarchaeota archaeon]|nr:phosphoribosylformylglycinamidine synthase subunit PurQ [Candidatus Bathyarchaeota archaeon]
MKKADVKVCLVRVAGTNCDAETKRSFQDLGVKAEIVHLNELVKRNNLLDYDVLVFPGGFSFGDYVRAGAILSKGFLAKLGGDLKVFVKEGKPILGICNGFQILVEAGLLPAFDGASEVPEAALATNFPIGFRCRWVHLRNENRGRCIFTSRIAEERVVRIPVNHAEGRFMFSKAKENECLERLLDNDQLVFRYCDETGQPAEGNYPLNPNGAFSDIAGICNPEGTVFGLMPHPERAYYGWQLPDWTRLEKPPKYGDGRLIFESVVEYVTRKF